MIKKSILYFASILILSGCGVRIPLKPNYFNSNNRVGIIVVTNPIKYGTYSGSGGGGLIGAIVSSAITSKLDPAEKFRFAYNIIGQEVNPTSKVKYFFIDYFSSKGKNIVSIDEPLNYDLATLKDFIPQKNKRKFFSKDVRYLKNKYQIDELLIVLVYYDVNSSYTYGLETRRYCRTLLFPSIINLNDNSLVYKRNSSKMIYISTKDMETQDGVFDLKQGIIESTDGAIYDQKVILEEKKE
jgi:hypothetical protein